MPEAPGGARTWCGLLAACLLGVVIGLSPARAGAAETGYRYWSFWERDAGAGRWLYATQGPGTLVPDDGEVLGFRFAVSTESADADRPQGEAGFAAICGGEAGQEGQEGQEGQDIRVALVIDFGTAADAAGEERPARHRRECATVPEGSTAADALAEVAGPLRYGSGGLLCAIAGYPRTGCAEQVTLDDGDGGSASDAAAGDSGGNGNGSILTVVAGAGVVVLLAAAALWRSRGRRA